MRFRDDQRGVTVQVGAVLLLGIIVISLSIYQVQVVPAQNEQVEFDHSQAVQTDMQQVRNAILGTATGGSDDPTAVTLGTRYPARTLFVNPPPASGTLSTADAGTLTVDNADAVNPETDDYWTGTQRTFATDRLVYSPDYAVYDNAPTTVYENSVVYNEFGGSGTVTLSDERLVDDRTISLVALDGRLSTARTTALTVDPEGVSASTRTVAVEGDGDPVTVTVPTRLSQSVWEDLLAEELVANGGHVDDLSVSGDTLTLTMEPGVYRLRLAKVGVGTNVAGTTPAYLTTVDAPETTTPGTTQQFTVEVRDGFDNPVSGETVTATADRGTVSVVGSSVSDEHGRVTFSYTAPPGVGDGDAQLNVSYDDPTRGDFAGGTPQDIAYTVDVESAGGGGGSSTARTVISTSFENEGTSLGDYGWSGNGAGESVGDFRAGSGTQAAYLGGEDAPNIIESPAVDTSGGGYLDIEFVASDDGAEAGVNEDLVVEYYDADGTWQEVTTVEAQAPDDVNFSRRHVVADAAAFHDQFRLRFRQPETTGTDRWYVDDVRVFVVGSGGGGGGGGGGDSPPARPQIDVRLDDLTDQRSNNPYYVLSHEVTNTNSSFKRVDVQFEPQGNGASASGSNTAARGSETFDDTYGSGVDYQVIVEAIYTDTNGNEYTAAQRTITDTADGRNPAGNDDLGTASSASLDSSTIQDRSKTQQNDVEFRIDYAVSSGDGFDRVKLAAVNRNGNGATTRADVARTSRNNYKLRPGDGAGTSYKISILVFDTDGVVVDSRIVVDDADGTDP